MNRIELQRDIRALDIAQCVAIEVMDRPRAIPLVIKASAQMLDDLPVLIDLLESISRWEKCELKHLRCLIAGFVRDELREADRTSTRLWKLDYHAHVASVAERAKRARRRNQSDEAQVELEVAFLSDQPRIVHPDREER